MQHTRWYMQGHNFKEGCDYEKGCAVELQAFIMQWIFQ